MSNELPPGQDQKEIQGLVMLVAENLQKGESPEAIAQQLVDNGWDQKEADGFVASIQNQLQNAQHQQRGEGGGGWLIWIAVLIGINLASYLFNWGFWLW